MLLGWSYLLHTIDQSPSDLNDTLLRVLVPQDKVEQRGEQLLEQSESWHLVDQSHQSIIEPIYVGH